MLKLFRPDRKKTVGILLEGKSVFEKLQILEGSVNFRREIYKEPKGVSKSSSVHLAELESSPAAPQF